MSEQDRCRDLRDQLPAYAAGCCETAWELRIQLHLAEGCAGCAVDLDRLFAAFHSIPLGEAPQPIPAEALDRLARAVAARPQDRPERPIVFPETRERRLLWTLLACFAVALAAAGLWGRHALREQHRLERELQRAQAQVRGVVDDYRRLEERCRGIDTALAGLLSPAASAHELPPGRDAARARAFVDLGQRELTLTARGLPRSVPEARLVAWWRQGDDWTALGAVDPAQLESGGAARVALPEGAALPARLSISAEAAAGEPPPRPTEPLLLDGVLTAGTPCAPAPP